MSNPLQNKYSKVIGLDAGSLDDRLYLNDVYNVVVSEGICMYGIYDWEIY